MDFQLQSDQDLIHLYVAGDEAGLVELLRRYQAKIYTSIYLLVKDEYLAEDIFQDAFIKVINTLRAGKYNEEGKSRLNSAGTARGANSLRNIPGSRKSETSGATVYRRTSPSIGKAGPDKSQKSSRMVGK